MVQAMPSTSSRSDQINLRIGDQYIATEDQSGDVLEARASSPRMTIQELRDHVNKRLGRLS